MHARLRQIEVGFHYGELAYDAWSTGYQAAADEDPQRLRDAIETAEDAIAYLDAEAEKDPHHAAVAGKLDRVHITRWENELDRLTTGDQ